MTEHQPFFTPDQQPSFKHSPLASADKQIRLLTLAPGDSDTPLSGSLTQHVLDAGLEYEALSYVWGPLEPKKSLHLDGQTFQLRPNIHKFLMRLRDRAEPRTLWLDAACIDQNNTTERGAQVSLMRKIYRSCRQCLVWLGEDIPRGDEVLKIFAANPVDSLGMTDLNNLIRLLYRHELADAFRALLSLSYWSRVWMIQETTLAAKVTVHTGSSTCLLDHIPTQVRGLMFEVFQTNRAQYQEWLKVFNDFDRPCYLRRLDMREQNALQHCAVGQVYPGLVGSELQRGQQSTMMLGFQQSCDQFRWEPWVVEVKDLGHNFNIHATFRTVISLSTVSGLSFSMHEFDPCTAFRSIECAFWCINDSRSEQLLDERRRYSDSANRRASPLDFRNYLEHADRWHCTDTRDRVFGALGVFTVWPQVSPFHADYSLMPEDLLVCLVDYCRPTDPFKLAIRLLSALEVDVESVSLASWSRRRPIEESKRMSLTLMSRISWSLQHFDMQRLTENPAMGLSVTVLRRSDVPGQAQTFLYFTPQHDPPQFNDTITSLGDAAVVLGIRAASPPQDNGPWSYVGIGFDVGFTFGRVDVHYSENISSAAPRITRLAPLDGTDSAAKLFEQVQAIDYTSLGQMMQNMGQAIIKKADTEEMSDDGTPVLWWIDYPQAWFLWLLTPGKAVKNRHTLYHW